MPQMAQLQHYKCSMSDVVVSGNFVFQPISCHWSLSLPTHALHPTPPHPTPMKAPTPVKASENLHFYIPIKRQKI